MNMIKVEVSELTNFELFDISPNKILHSQYMKLDPNNNCLDIDISINNIDKQSLVAHFYLAIDRDLFPDLSQELSRYRFIHLPFSHYTFVFSELLPQFLLRIRFDVKELINVVSLVSLSKEKGAKQKKLLPDLIKLKKQM